MQQNWFTRLPQSPERGPRLFCFPYAGGGVPVFRGWAEGLPGVAVWAAVLPGRGARLKERPLTNLAELVERLGEAITPLTGEPYAFFGHSLGARVAYELACWLRRQGRPQPHHLFLSASPAPGCPQRQATLHDLPRDAFIAALRQRHALPDELLAHRELLDLVLPALRADFALVETAVPTNEAPLDCPLTLFGGTADPQVSAADLAAWDSYSTHSLTHIPLPGDHLFLLDPANRREMLGVIGRCLSRIEKREGE